jgi:hypothetical protein
MLHPAPPSVKNERTKAVVLDISKQWRALEEARLEHRARVQEDARLTDAARTALQADREELARETAKQQAAVSELKVRGRRWGGGCSSNFAVSAASGHAPLGGSVRVSLRAPQPSSHGIRVS